MMKPEESKTNDTGTVDDEYHKFQKEVSWCIDQLRMGMFTKNPTVKQVKECERVIKVLTSSKAPLVKKRQAMRQMFGDYRKKIEIEEKKWEKDTIKQTERLKISTATPSNKSGFLRTAHSCTNNTTANKYTTNGELEKSSVKQECFDTVKTPESMQNFHFNFNVDQEISKDKRN